MNNKPAPRPRIAKLNLQKDTVRLFRTKTAVRTGQIVMDQSCDMASCMGTQH